VLCEGKYDLKEYTVDEERWETEPAVGKQMEINRVVFPSLWKQGGVGIYLVNYSRSVIANT
jgi:hypothetical protein